MGTKLAWTGLWIILAGGTFSFPAAAIVGAVIMLIGVVLICLDR
jgi:hypothetical protein